MDFCLPTQPRLNNKKTFTGPFLEFKRSTRYVKNGHPTYLPTIDMILQTNENLKY